MTNFRLFLVFSILFACQSLFVTAQGVRYRDPIFSTVKITNNVKYGSAVNYFNYNETLDMDIYEPSGDALTKRPVVVMIFGGSFLVGRKGATDMVAWGKELAKHGYVVVSIDYRLGFTIGSQRSAVRAVYRAVQDARAAIRFLYKNRTTYKLDMDRLFIGGESAGSITAIHTAFMDTDAKRPIETRSASWYVLENSDMGCLDCSGNNISAPVNIKGIINLWGAINNVNNIEARHNIPMVSIHGEDDTTVSINTASPYDASYFFPSLSGSRPITNRMNALGKFNQFFPYPGQGHVFYGTPDISFPNDFWPPVFQQGKNFLYTMLQRLAAGTPIMTADNGTPTAATKGSLSSNKVELVNLITRPQELDIILSAEESADALVRVVDLTGRVIYQNTQYIYEGENNFSVEFNSLAQGFYVLQIQTGEQNIARKFVVR
jgi:acetyl esterase/lipase